MGKEQSQEQKPDEQTNGNDAAEESKDEPVKT